MNRLVLSFLVAFCLVVAPRAHAVAYRSTNIADTTSVAPVGTFTGFDAPAISGNTVAFRSFYPGGHGIFQSGGESLTTIAKIGDTALSGKFNFLNDPAISGDVVAFLGSVADQRQTSAIFTSSGGSLTTIAMKGDAAPSGTFDAFASPSINGDTVAFRGVYPDGIGIFTGSGGPRHLHW